MRRSLNHDQKMLIRTSVRQYIADTERGTAVTVLGITLREAMRLANILSSCDEIEVSGESPFFKESVG